MGVVGSVRMQQSLLLSSQLFPGGTLVQSRGLMCQGNTAQTPVNQHVRAV